MAWGGLRWPAACPLGKTRGGRATGPRVGRHSSGLPPRGFRRQQRRGERTSMRPPSWKLSSRTKLKSRTVSSCHNLRWSGRAARVCEAGCRALWLAGRSTSCTLFVRCWMPCGVHDCCARSPSAGRGTGGRHPGCRRAGATAAVSASAAELLAFSRTGASGCVGQARGHVPACVQVLQLAPDRRQLRVGGLVQRHLLQGRRGHAAGGAAGGRVRGAVHTRRPSAGSARLAEP